ncbi:hypothetical protein M9Y10_032882 [Tritrichomonas musculus]|uniref:Uncharacterized protein n=1 Tax=Tritrichomonas musculus TaxID=1915356 RepID=A0ABR2GZ58_9EUKA
MNDTNQKENTHEMAMHLSTIQNHVDTTIQDLGNRKNLVRVSSDKSIKVANDLNGRIGTLQKYSSALNLKRKDMQGQIDLFHQKNNEKLNLLKHDQESLENEIESLDQKLVHISNQITENKLMIDKLSNQIQLYDKENENLDIQSFRYQEILNRPVPLDRNDDIKDCIQEVQRSLKQIDEKIQFKSNLLHKFQNDIQVLQPITQINKSLLKVNERFVQAQEDEYLVNKRIEIEHSISKEKQEKLSLLLSQIKENNDGIDAFRNNFMQIKAIDMEIDREKEKKSQILTSATPIESELRRIEQEYDIEIKKEIKMAHDFNELEEKERNRDPSLILLENKVSELNEELRLIIQKKDDLTIIENNLQCKYDSLDQKTLLTKEKLSREITEGRVFHEQKLYKEIRNHSNSNDEMNKKIEELIMMINVFEAERKRLYRKIAIALNKLEKYKEKEMKMKKLKKKNKIERKKLNNLQLSIEALQFKINELTCINDHKKEDIQTKKLSIEQTLLKFYLPNQQQSFSKSNILSPILPILSNRGEAAKIISETALYVKKIFLFQQNAWKDIDQDEIKNAFERWDDTLEKIKPSIEKNILQAFVEFVC